MITTTTVKGTSVLTGNARSVLDAMAAAGMMITSLPAEKAADLKVEPPKNPQPVAAVVEAVKAAAPAVIDLTTEYTRPSGERFFAREIVFGGRRTTDVQLIRDGIEAGLNLFFVGKPGCGKTAAIEAALWNWAGTHGLETIVGNDNTEAADFVGGLMPQPDRTFRWIDGALIRAWRDGKGLYVDEIGRINPKVLTVLFAAMDGREVLEIPENPELGAIPKGKGFFVIASTNPDSPGCVMDDALLSRFAPPIEYTTDFSIAERFLGVRAEAVALAKEMTKDVKAGTSYWAPTMRDLIQFKIIEKVFGTKAAWQGLVTAAPIEAQPDVIAKIADTVKIKVDGAFEV